MDTNNNIHFGRSSDPGQIYVNGLTINITRDDLMEYFSRFGAVVDSVFVNAIENHNKVFNFGFVTFADPSVADLLIDGRRMHRINGETVRIHKPFQTGSADSQVNRGEENLSNEHHDISLSDMRSEGDVESSVQQDRLAYGRQGGFGDGQSSHGINDSNGVNSNGAAGTSPKSPRYQFQENTSTSGKRDHRHRRQYHHHHHRRQHHNHHHRHNHYHRHCHHHHFYSHVEMDKESVTSPSSKS